MLEQPGSRLFPGQSGRADWPAKSQLAPGDNAADSRRLSPAETRGAKHFRRRYRPRFFAIILAEAGYQVTAVDATASMLAEAKRNSGALSETIDFRLMDAQELTFEDSSFDVVLSRNLTWVLEKPEQTYLNWQNVLRPGGLLLNFDANWYNYLHDDALKQCYEQDRRNVSIQQIDDHYLGTDIDAMEAIALRVPLTGVQRPEWDLHALNKIKMRSVTSDNSVWQRVWSPVEKINYASTPMFMIAAVK